jgi:hypothetical protein
MQRIANPSSPVRLWIAPPKFPFGIKKIAPSGAIFVCGWYLVAATLSWTEIGQKRIPVPPHQSSRRCSVEAVLHAHSGYWGTPFKIRRSRPPPYPHPLLSQMGPPASTCTVFRSNDLEIGDFCQTLDLQLVCARADNNRTF